MVGPDIGRAFQMAQEADPTVTVVVDKTAQGSYTFTVTTKDGKRKWCVAAPAVEACAVLCKIAHVRPVEHKEWSNAPYRPQHTNIFAVLYDAARKKHGISRSTVFYSLLNT